MAAEVISQLGVVRSLLSRHGPAPVVADWQRLEPWTVARVRLEGAGHPRQVIVKWGRDHPDRTRTLTWRLRTELAALRFLSDDLGLRLAPRVVAADPAAEVIVLEDLFPRTPLDQLLRAEGATAHAERLAAFAGARGELNAATAGRAAVYYARRAALGPVDAAADRTGRWVGLRAEGIGQAADFGVAVSGPAESELVSVLEELDEPGPFLAFSNGDPEANNVLVHASGDPDPRLIDFEFAGYTHALSDAVCLHVPGPAWLSIGDAEAGGPADAYRRALARGVPEAEDDRRYGFGLAAACFSYMFVRLQRLGAVDGRPPGDHSRLQLVATLEAAARTAAAHGALPHLAGWALRTSGLLRRRWPDADLDLTDPASFPAYSPRLR
ncbi:aminoglycoside phosphotransferase family protein [Sphaerisporangium aureirubrum]|uniref:Aminoglycoside phosphotransferase domain-containing protein n=1 Tax=Sphaerisporangium aureirubrum TaxID=1544736 RepID=A0ABW1NIA7_9ACTN